MLSARTWICCLALVLACGGQRASVTAVEQSPAALAAAGPYLSPEFPIDHPMLGTGSGNYGTKAAFDGTGYLVVWRDERQALSHIYATRVDASGKVLDPLGIVVGSTTSHIQRKPDVAFGAGYFLVVWEESGGALAPKIYATRISSAGTVLDPAGIAVSSESYGDQLTPAVAFDGSNFMVTWALGMSSGGRIAAARVSPAGNVLDATPVTVSKISSTYAQVQGEPAIAFDGTNYLVAWQDDRDVWWDIYANRISPAGTVLDGNGFPVAASANGENTPAIAFDGTNYLVTWSDWPSGGSRESSIYARRVSPAGTVLDATALAICTATGEQSAPTAVFDGSQFVVAWADSRAAPGQIFSARVSGAGQILDPDGHALTSQTSTAFEPSLVFGGGQLLFTWSDITVRGARLDLSEVSKDGAGFPLVSTPNTEADPAVAFGATDYLVVWSDSRVSGPNIFGARVSPGGGVLDPAGFAVSTSPVSQSHPLVAWNGAHYLVLWSGSQVAGRRVAANGTVVDAADIQLPSTSPGAVASDGTSFLVVGAPGGGTNTIIGYRVSAAGALLDTTPFTISSADGLRINPRVAFDGTNYLVVWQDSRASTYYHLYAARVSPDGAVVDADGFALVDTAVAGSQNSPEVASDGAGTSLVVWEDARSSSITGTRIDGNSVVDPAGVVIQARPTTSDVLSNPRVAFDGTNFVVGWVDEKFDVNYQVLSYTLRTARLSPQGTVLGGLQVATHPSEDLPSRVASDRAGGTIFTYAIPDTTAGFPVSHARGRIFFEDPPSGACRLPADCTTGFCVDGVCCDNACGGGSSTDCIACSQAAGAVTDGICGSVADGHGCSDSNACSINDICTQGICAGTLSTYVPGTTCSGSLDAGRPDGPRDDARPDGGDSDADGRALDAEVRADGLAPTGDTRTDAVRLTDAAAPDATSTIFRDAAYFRDTAASSDLSVSDLRLVDTQAAVNPDAARAVDAGAVIPGDASTAKQASSGCSCNQGRTSSNAPWPFAIVLAIGALAGLRRRHGGASARA